MSTKIDGWIASTHPSRQGRCRDRVLRQPDHLPP
jgi:hypothetical protein